MDIGLNRLNGWTAGVMETGSTQDEVGEDSEDGGTTPAPGQARTPRSESARKALLHRKLQSVYLVLTNRRSKYSVSAGKPAQRLDRRQKRSLMQRPASQDNDAGQALPGYAAPQSHGPALFRGRSVYFSAARGQPPQKDRCAERSAEGSAEGAAKMDPFFSASILSLYFRDHFHRFRFCPSSPLQSIRGIPH